VLVITRVTHADEADIGWKALFEVLWPRYEDIFTVIQRNIEQHKSLIDRQVNILVIKEARRESVEALKRYQEERDFREFCKLEKNISSHDYRPRLYDVESKHCAETGKWIFSDTRFQSWLNAGSSEGKQRLLWLAGVPGAGNSLIAIGIAARLLNIIYNRQNVSLLFHFTVSPGKSASR